MFVKIKYIKTFQERFMFLRNFSKTNPGHRSKVDLLDSQLTRKGSICQIALTSNRGPKARKRFGLVARGDITHRQGKWSCFIALSSSEDSSPTLVSLLLCVSRPMLCISISSFLSLLSFLFCFLFVSFLPSLSFLYSGPLSRMAGSSMSPPPNNDEMTEYVHISTNRKDESLHVFSVPKTEQTQTIWN